MDKFQNLPELFFTKANLNINNEHLLKYMFYTFEFQLPDYHKLH